MAKKFQRKLVRRRDNRNLIIIGIFVVTITMLLSGFFYFSSDRTTPGIYNEGQIEPWIDKYQISQIGNFSIIAHVTDVTSDFIVMPSASCVDFETIREIQNISVNNIKVSSEVAEPATLFQPVPMICGFYMLFKFNTDEGNISLEELKGEISEKLSKFSVFQGYIATLPVNISGTDQVYIVGYPENRVGDYLRVVLYQKITTGIGTGMIGFEERKIPVGPVLSATVVNITDIIVQGTIDTDLPSDIQEKLNVTEFNFLPPKILINETIGNKTADRLKNLTGVNVFINSEENKTEISFNSSKEKMIEVLNKEKLNYSLQEGGIIFRIPLDSDINYVMKTLTDNNIQDLRFGKEGLISLAREFILENKVVPIGNNERFDAVLEMDRRIGDRINVSVNTLRFGEQVIAFGASEVINQASSL